MNDFLFARSQMAMSLAFHIVFAALGIGMPLLMALAEGMHLRTRQPVYLDLCKRWSKGTAVLFAVGAVSGTVLSFELGLLWPGFMAQAGAVIGMPFSLEGFAFFAEAIFLGVYLYGWKRVSPIVHWLAGVLVAVSGVFSGIFVVTANAWMNAPAGFTIESGRFTDVDPVAAMLNRASPHEVVHTVLAAFVATGFLVAAVHARFLLRDRTNPFHRAGLRLALGLVCVSTPLQILSGDLSARAVGRLQPAKLAAMEAHYRTQTGAPLLIGGLPDDNAMTTRYALRIPGGLSLLLNDDPHSRVAGLDTVPRDQWPNVLLVHWSFDIMVGCGFAMLAVAVCVCWMWLKGRFPPDNPWVLRGIVATGPLGVLAIETGWMVTELGRQPWIIYGVMRTRDAVTLMPGLIAPFALFTAVYIVLAIVVALLLNRQFHMTIDNGASSLEEAGHA
jgi:cytochrome d ubiquinol oxidase subunit I